MQQTPKADVYGNITHDNIEYYVKKRKDQLLL